MGTQSRGAGIAARRRAHAERTRREADALAAEGATSAAPSAVRSVASDRGSRAASSAVSERGSRATAQTSRRERPVACRRRWTRGKVAALVLTLLVVALAGAVIAGFSWLRWFAHDDAADIQGTWYLAGTSTPIVIDDERIQLTEDVAYHYTLDPNAKTIEFTFGSLTGGGCYRFSLDRDELALVDGTFTGTDTLARDIGWTLEALIERLRDGDLAPAEESGKGLTLLSRTPTSGASAHPKAVRDTPAPDDGEGGGSGDTDGVAADGADDAGDASADGGDGGDAQTIQDEPVGDLSGKIPADINDPQDKAADDAAASGASDDAAGAAGTSGASGSGTASGSGSASSGGAASGSGV